MSGAMIDPTFVLRSLNGRCHGSHFLANQRNLPTASSFIALGTGIAKRIEYFNAEIPIEFGEL